ncbi:MAG: DUF4836 family protein [Prevotella sp.]|nr:DUF4836 family protein [Candidatus Prevotella equi]
MKRILTYTLFFIAMLLSSCSKRNYTNAIPSNSVALITVNAMDFVNGNSPFSHIVTPFVSDDKKELKGIDLTKNIYIFETADGMIGFCAPISDAYELESFLKRMKELKAVSDFSDIDDVTFCTISDSWLIGFDNDMLLAMGPITGNDAKKSMKHRMVKMMNQEEEDGITKSQLWQHSEEVKSPMRLVAQASALPEQIIASMMIGAPKGTDPADVLIEASMEYKDNTLYLNGSACSYNTNVKQAMKKVEECYKPITFNWEKMLSDSTLIGVFTNVNGKDFVEHLQTNKALNTMLMGCSAYDRIRDNNGDLAILLTPKDMTSLEENVTCRVVNIAKGNVKNKECFIVAINLGAIKGPVKNVMSPFLGKINRIVYRINK